MYGFQKYHPNFSYDTSSHLTQKQTYGPKGILDRIMDLYS